MPNKGNDDIDKLLDKSNKKLRRAKKIVAFTTKNTKSAEELDEIGLKQWGYIIN